MTDEEREEGLELTKDLEVPLSPEERAERGRMLAACVLEIAQVEASAKEIAGQWNAKKKKLEKRRYDLSMAVDSGKERRAIPCEERANTRVFRVETVRLDTNEVIDVRPMTEEELADAQQGKLFTARATAKNDGDEPADSGELPDPEVLDVTRGPDARVTCPGPAGGEGCGGEHCSRCAGLGFVPTVSVEAPEESGTAIDNPAAVLGEDDDAAPKPSKRSKRDRSLAEGAH